MGLTKQKSMNRGRTSRGRIDKPALELFNSARVEGAKVAGDEVG